MDFTQEELVEVRTALYLRKMDLEQAISSCDAIGRDPEHWQICISHVNSALHKIMN